MRNAHIRDGVALTSFLAWLAETERQCFRNFCCYQIAGISGNRRIFSRFEFGADLGKWAKRCYRSLLVTTEQIAIFNRAIYTSSIQCAVSDRSTDVTRTSSLKELIMFPKRSASIYPGVEGSYCYSEREVSVGANGGQIDAIAH